MSNNKAPEIKKHFGRRLKELRLQLRLTQRQLADAVGIHVSFVSDMETGKKAPNLVICFDLAEALGVHVSDLLPESSGQYRKISMVEAWLRKNPDITLREIVEKVSGSQ